MVFSLRNASFFIDDILIFSKIFDEQLHWLESVFSRLDNHNMKLKPSKFEFLKSSAAYPSHLISVNGIETDPSKTETVRKLM